MIKASAPGKVNLHFEVGPLRADGYHSVISLYQGLAIRQSVSVEPSESWQVETTGDLPAEQLKLVPADEANLVVIAAKRLAEYVGIENPQPMRFLTHKQVPVAAGLAGGSADAAAALVALNEAWCLGLDAEQLAEVGAKVGSDVPFALLGGTALGVDTGIELTSLEPIQNLHFALAISPVGLSTGKVFAKFDELCPSGDLSSTAAELRSALERGELNFGKNSLLEPALHLKPELAELVRSSGMPLALSGSGPTLFFASFDSDAVSAVAGELSARGLLVIQTQSDERGAELD